MRTSQSIQYLSIILIAGLSACNDKAANNTSKNIADVNKGHDFRCKGEYRPDDSNFGKFKNSLVRLPEKGKVNLVPAGTDTSYPEYFLLEKKSHEGVDGLLLYVGNSRDGQCGDLRLDSNPDWFSASAEFFEVRRWRYQDVEGSSSKLSCERVTKKMDRPASQFECTWSDLESEEVIHVVTLNTQENNSFEFEHPKFNTKYSKILMYAEVKNGIVDVALTWKWQRPPEEGENPDDYDVYDVFSYGDGGSVFAFDGTMNVLEAKIFADIAHLEYSEIGLTCRRKE